MSTHRNVIEINGALYDAVNGRLLHNKKPVKKPARPTMDAVTHTPTPSKHNAHATHAHAGKKTRATATQHQQHTTSKTAHNPKVSSPRHKITPAQRQPQKPITLARQAVSKPSIELDTQSEKLDVATNHQPLFTAPIDPRRIKRAKIIRKSSAISKFGSFSATDTNAADVSVPGDHHVQKKTAPLAVKEAPPHMSGRHKKHQTTYHRNSGKPIKKTAAEETFMHAMHKSHAHKSHTGKPHKKHISHRLGLSRKTLNVGTAALAVLLLIGFFAYQNVPNMSMRLAATRAGFDARMPNYQPSGFSLQGPIEYGPGHITVSFGSHSDERQYNLTQKVSNWTSEALAENFLARADTPYQTFRERGKTVYIYGDNNATWVNGGVWYQIEGNANLSSEQLLNIINSI